MFDFKLLKNEKIIIISDEALLKYQNTIENVSVIITNKRFIILNYPKDIESFRIGKIINTFKTNKKEIIFETKITEFDKIIDGKDFDKYILKDSNYFYLIDEKIKTYLKNNKKIN